MWFEQRLLLKRDVFTFKKQLPAVAAEVEQLPHHKHLETSVGPGSAMLARSSVSIPERRNTMENQSVGGCRDPQTEIPVPCLDKVGRSGDAILRTSWAIEERAPK